MPADLPWNGLSRRHGAAWLGGVDLRAVRQACGITQETMAAALGVSRPAVSSYENRSRRPPAAYCRVIAGLMRHLEVPRD